MIKYFHHKAILEIRIANKKRKLGIGFRTDNFAILQLKEGGLVSCYNQVNHGAKVEVGDVMLRVNGANLQTAAQYHDAVASSKVLELTLQKGGAGV